MPRGVLHPQDGCRLPPHAARGESAVGRGQVEETHLPTPQREAQVVAADIVQGGDAQIVSQAKDRVDAYFVHDPYSGHVQGRAEGIAQRDKTVELGVVVVGRIPFAFAGEKAGPNVGDGAGRGIAPAESGGIGNGLDGGAGLTGGQGHVDRPVDVLIEVVGAAYHGQDLTCRRLQSHKASVGHVMVGQAGHVAPNDVLGYVLHVQVQGRVYAKPALLQGLGA